MANVRKHNPKYGLHVSYVIYDTAGLKYGSKSLIYTFLKQAEQIYIFR